jgi:tetratricopeptide (TPR) repeat protein
VVEGSVRRAGNRLPVTAQLIHAADATHLWSERYDRDMTDVFAIQDEIGQAISEALKLRLASRTRTVNVEVYQNYLKAQYYRARPTAESLAKAKECFERALAIDPNHAPAYSGLAGVYYVLAVLEMKVAGDVVPLAKSAAEKALAIDPADREALSVLGVVAASYDYDWQAAGTHFRQAMTVEPVPTLVRIRYITFYLLRLGRLTEAAEQSRLGLETDPLSMLLHFSMVQSMFYAGQYRETIEYARRALKIDPDFYYIWFTMGLAQLLAGFTQEAITSLERVVVLAPWYYTLAWHLAAPTIRLVIRIIAGNGCAKLADSHCHTVGAAVYYAAVGGVDAMFEALDGAYRQRDLNLSYLPSHPFFDPYRADSRYHALLQRMNLA